jgi:hypothetical protein
VRGAADGGFEFGAEAVERRGQVGLPVGGSSVAKWVM